MFMKKFTSILVAALILATTNPIYLVACGLPPCNGGVLISGGGGCSGNPNASVYDCGGYIQVISSSLPGGGCAGSHRDCSSSPQR